MAGMSLRTQLAYLAAGLTLALGLLSLLNPLLMVRILGLEVLEPRGLSEIRATYGMLFLAMGGVMLWAIPTRPRSNPFLRFAALLWGATALGRATSVVIDGVITPLNLAALALELLVAFSALQATVRDPARRRGARSRPVEETPDPLRAYRG